MDVSINGKNMDVGDTLHGHVESSLTSTVTKYFDKAVDASVTFAKEAHLFRADITVHPLRGMVLKGGDAATDAYAAFDGALARIAKQLRRYKRRLKDHKGREEEPLAAQYTIFAPEAEDEVPENGQPVIVAEMAHSIDTLTVGEAVMRMDLADSPLMMFRNSAHGGLNVVYRRKDGNIGWIDPRGTRTTQG